jgi:hypothetical protein
MHFADINSHVLRHLVIPPGIHIIASLYHGLTEQSARSELLDICPNRIGTLVL